MGETVGVHYSRGAISLKNILKRSHESFRPVVEARAFHASRFVAAQDQSQSVSLTQVRS